MSPEAIQCSPDVDARTDIYGFGVIMFEALTGTPPFPGEPGIELFAQIVDEPPPDLVAYRPDLPPEVALVVGRALAKQPDDRFPDMERFVLAVESLVLPSPQGPHTVTPGQGVIPGQIVELKSGAVIPGVGEGVKKEPSGSIHQNKTRFLFSLASASRFGFDKSNLSPKRILKRPNLAHIVTRAHRLLTCLSRMGRLHWRTAITAGLAVALVATTYWAATGRPKGRGTSEKEHSNSLPPAQVSVPQITRLPSPPPAARSSILSGVDDAAIRPAASKSPFSLKRPARKEAFVRRGPAAAANSVHGRRAGSLSAADF
jgi:serine/threonine protein kinase